MTVFLVTYNDNVDPELYSGDEILENVTSADWRRRVECVEQWSFVEETDTWCRS
jgi:hypothetical protein